jgi:probable rRNA maturation factor
MLVAIEVEISDTQTHLPVDRASLQQLVTCVLEQEGRKRASISIALVDDATIHSLNRVHLGHDWPTDVITFPLSEPDDPVLTGELVISVETTVKSANELELDACDELALYVVHGLLHLCGYDDRNEADALAMRRRESEVLSRVQGIGPGSHPASPRPVTD